MMKRFNCFIAGSAEAVLLQTARGSEGHRHARAGARQPVRHLERAAAQRGQVRAREVPSATRASSSLAEYREETVGLGVYVCARVYACVWFGFF